MKVIAFITDYAAVDRIIDHLKLRFNAEKPPPSRVLTEVASMAVEESGEYFYLFTRDQGEQMSIVF